MIYFKAIFALISNLPDLIALLKQIGQAVDAGEHYIDVRISLGKFDDAAKKAKDDKDTSGLENLFNPPPKS